MLIAIIMPSTLLWTMIVLVSSIPHLYIFIRSLFFRPSSLLPPETTKSKSVEAPEPGVTTFKPVSQLVTISKPGVTTSKPGVTTSKPGVTTSKPGVITSKPGVTTSKPGVTTSKPGVTTSKPGVPTSKPGVITSKPEVTTFKPGVITSNSGLSTNKPETRIPYPIVAGQKTIIFNPKATSFISTEAKVLVSFVPERSLEMRGIVKAEIIEEQILCEHIKVKERQPHQFSK